MPFLGLELLAAKRARAEDSRSAQAVAPPSGAPTPDAPREAHPSLEPTPEQVRYARVLERGARLGLLCLFVTFPLYVLGIIEPHVPIEKVLDSWGLEIQQYHACTGTGPGWAWVRLLGRGDFLNFVGIIILAGVTAVCYVAVVPLMLQRGDRVYAVLALLQVVVLILAASGILAVGH